MHQKCTDTHPLTDVPADEAVLYTVLAYLFLSLHAPPPRHILQRLRIPRLRDATKLTDSLTPGCAAVIDAQRATADVTPPL